MVPARQLLTFWKQIFSQWQYLLIAAVTIGVFHYLHAFILNFVTLKDTVREISFIAAIHVWHKITIGTSHTIPTHVYIFLIITSVLLGILVALIVYNVKTTTQGQNLGWLAITGTALGIIAPGCAACGVGILALFGISATALAILPFHGFELSIIAVIILTVAIYKITQRSVACKIR